MGYFAKALTAAVLLLAICLFVSCNTNPKDEVTSMRNAYTVLDETAMNGY